ncbi:hypothetical protein ABEB36_015126 [Hypothenemus hampei]|uniref:DDE Tnp4 domain-containing protein n=1 Tax=Hypothenemus hampei TaxID=57062 RepID=A0ABD1E0G0_HYPHA
MDELVKETPVSKMDKVFAGTDKAFENTTFNFDVISSSVANESSDVGVQVETMFFTSKFMDFITTENDFSTATGIQSYKIFHTIVGMVQIVYGESLSNCKMTLNERIIMTYQSDLIRLLEPGDAVMTDKGFLIEELCA